MAKSFEELRQKMTPKQKIASADKTRELILEMQIPMEDLKVGCLYECLIDRTGANCAVYLGNGRFAYAEKDKYMGGEQADYQLCWANYRDSKPDNVSGLVSPLRELEEIPQTDNATVLECLKKWEHSADMIDKGLDDNGNKIDGN